MGLYLARLTTAIGLSIACYATCFPCLSEQQPKPEHQYVVAEMRYIYWNQVCDIEDREIRMNLIEDQQAIDCAITNWVECYFDQVAIEMAEAEDPDLVSRVAYQHLLEYVERCR